MFKTKLLIGLLVGILILFLILVLFRPRSTKNIKPPSIPKADSSPSTFSSSALNEVKGNVSAVALTKEEQDYPQAPSQDFSKYDTSVVGQLVVTTTPSDARILIDANEEDSDAPISSVEVSPPPTKTSPFAMSNIPVGKHSLSIFKRGFLEETIKFEIAKDKVTRLDIKLRTPESY